MDLPALKAFVSPRNNFRLRPSSNDDFNPTKTSKPLTSKDKNRCPSSRLLKTSEKGLLNQCIKDLQGSIVSECKRIEEKIKSVHEKLPSSLMKENQMQNGGGGFRSCQNLNGKKLASKTLLDKMGGKEMSMKVLKKDKERTGVLKEDTLKSTKHKSKQLHLDKIKPNLHLSQESDWVPNRKLQGLLSSIYTSTNALSKNFQKQRSREKELSKQLTKPKTIKTLFHTKINSDSQILPLKPNKPFPSTLPHTTTPTIKDFKIIKKLGKGKFGNVYLAQQKTTNFLVALKSIQKRSLKENDMYRQLIQEIKIQLFLDHPNILKMYGYFDDLDTIYLILEAIPLGNIFRELKQQKRFTEKKSAGYLKQVLEALTCLHNFHILHRDIKPENILNGYGILKLSDFGWSIYSPQENRETFCGTLDYVSPEIVVGKAYDFMVDVWSIGILAYQFVTGHAPFENKGGSQNETYQKILKTKITYPEYVGEGVRDFVGKILVKNPKKRMGLVEAAEHEWLAENCKGSVAVSKSIFNCYLKLM